jgi:hypothetical protein
MSVTYPNDAFAFAVDRQAGSGNNGGEWNEPEDDDTGVVEVIGGLFVLAITLFILIAPFVYLYKFIMWIIGGIGFGSKQEMKKKITRTKIEYFENCPSCGAAREEGKDSCQYCGRSMIKSKEIIEEEEIVHELTDAEQISLMQIELLKTELITMCRYKNGTSVTYNYPPDKRNVMHDDRVYSFGLLCWQLAQLRRGQTLTKRKDDDTELARPLTVTTVDFD